MWDSHYIYCNTWWLGGSTTETGQQVKVVVKQHFQINVFFTGAPLSVFNYKYNCISWLFGIDHIISGVLKYLQYCGALTVTGGILLKASNKQNCISAHLFSLVTLGYFFININCSLKCIKVQYNVFPKDNTCKWMHPCWNPSFRLSWLLRVF